SQASAAPSKTRKPTAPLRTARPSKNPSWLTGAASFDPPCQVKAPNGLARALGDYAGRPRQGRGRELTGFRAPWPGRSESRSRHRAPLPPPRVHPREGRAGRDPPPQLAPLRTPAVEATAAPDREAKGANR